MVGSLGFLSLVQQPAISRERRSHWCAALGQHMQTHRLVCVSGSNDWRHRRAIDAACYGERSKVCLFSSQLASAQQQWQQRLFSKRVALRVAARHHQRPYRLDIGCYTTDRWSRDDETKTQQQKEKKKTTNRRELKKEEDEHEEQHGDRKTSSVFAYVYRRRSWDVAHREFWYVVMRSDDPVYSSGWRLLFDGHGSDVQKLSSAVARRPLTPPTRLPCWWSRFSLAFFFFFFLVFPQTWRVNTAHHQHHLKDPCFIFSPFQKWNEIKTSPHLLYTVVESVQYPSDEVH